MTKRLSVSQKSTLLHEVSLWINDITRVAARVTRKESDGVLNTVGKTQLDLLQRLFNPFPVSFHSVALAS